MLFDFSQKVYKEISRTGYNNKTKLIFWRVFQLFPHTLSLRLLQSQSLSATIPSKHPPLVLQIECNIEHIQLKSLPLHTTQDHQQRRWVARAIRHRLQNFRIQNSDHVSNSHQHIHLLQFWGIFSRLTFSCQPENDCAHFLGATMH